MEFLHVSTESLKVYFQFSSFEVCKFSKIKEFKIRILHGELLPYYEENDIWTLCTQGKLQICWTKLSRNEIRFIWQKNTFECIECASVLIRYIVKRYCCGALPNRNYIERSLKGLTFCVVFYVV